MNKSANCNKYLIYNIKLILKKIRDYGLRYI